MSEAPRRNVLRGIVRLARFRPEGFAEFVGSRQGFLNSLAPLVAFPLVGSAMMAVAGEGAGAAVDLLATLVALLAPAVISQALAARWGRDDRWLRYAVAFNWAQWAVPVVAIGMLIAMVMLRRMGMSERGAAMAALFGIAGYGLALHWFLARAGLALSRGRAALMVLALNAGTVMLAIAPRFLAVALR